MRKKNPRRILLEELRDMKRYLGLLVDFWNVAGRVVEVQREDGRVTGHTFRDRQYDEYRENVPSNWSDLARNARAMAQRWETIAGWAENQAAEAVRRAADR